MRKQRKFVSSTTFDTNNREFVINLPRDRYLYGLLLEFQMRHRVTAAATTLMPEAPWNVIRRIRVEMNHEIFGAETLFNMSGASLAAYRAFYDGRAPRANVDVDPLTVQVSESDISLVLPIIFPPENIVPKDQERFLIDGPRCSVLDLKVDWGNADSNIEGGTTALTNYGGTTGNPIVNVTAIQVMDKPDLPLTALVKRISREITMASAITNDKLDDLATGESVRSFMLKQYVRSTTAGQPTSVVATLLDPHEIGDAGLSLIGVRVNEEFKHRYDNWQMLRETNRAQYRASALPIAYGIIEFVEDGDIDESLFTQDFISDRKRLDLAGTVGTAVANTRLEITTTSLNGNPQRVAA